MLIKTKYKVLFAGLFALAMAFPASALRYQNYDLADSNLTVISSATSHNFINSGHVYRDCGRKEVCRYAKSQYVKDAKIDKIWVYKKKSPYNKGDEHHVVLYEKTKDFEGKPAYCLVNKVEKVTSARFKVKTFVRFNRHIVDLDNVVKGGGNKACRNLGGELKAAIYGEAGDIMPKYFTKFKTSSMKRL